MPFYCFTQNNSGGRWRGPHYVIIEATSAREANNLAEDKASIYFDGVSTDRDCSCCGSRWYRVYDNAADPEPMIYDKPLLEYRPGIVWTEGGDPVEVYYLNGKVENYRINKGSVEAV